MANPVVIDCALFASGTDAIGLRAMTDTDALYTSSDATTDLFAIGGVAINTQGCDYATATGTINPNTGDRAVVDALAYPARHANDIDGAAGIHHTLAMLDARYASITPSTIWVPLSNGDPVNPSLIFDAEGACIMVEVTL